MQTLQPNTNSSFVYKIWQHNFYHLINYEQRLYIKWIEKIKQMKLSYFIVDMHISHFRIQANSLARMNMLMALVQ
jgi:hypothetical protein